MFTVPFPLWLVQTIFFLKLYRSFQMYDFTLLLVYEIRIIKLVEQ